MTEISEASPYPLGVSLREGGINVAVMSRHAARVFFCLFEGGIETRRVALGSRLGDVHFGFIAGIGEGAEYGLRAEGPWEPGQGHRFDPSKLLLDPYAQELSGPFNHHTDLTRFGVETAELVPKAVVRRIATDAQPLPSKRPGFIYEVPVRAFTKLHPQVPPEKRGTVAALAEPVVIDHFKRLGVDTVELMPLMAWIDERHLPPLGLRNAWGYNPVSFFAPDPRLAPGGLAEVRQTVDALHAAGIRVILDVVFNHTGESDEDGATLSLRGLDNALYYRHAEGKLVNDTGCGNTLALDRAAGVQLAMDAMRSWVSRTGLDGFRFDLATVMGRRPEGFDPDAPLLAAIAQDPLLSTRIMIAEPWDVGPGGYQLGGFPAPWLEWNDRYRDAVRDFWNGAATPGALATRIAGSSDVFAPHRPPSASVNYVAAHDGFTLRDAVTYAAKDNFANGENNRDGNAHEPVWPGGNVKALLATLFLSRGTPMLTAGDEFGRSQKGNNNAYAQDNALTWLDWNTADGDLMAFTSSLAKLRAQLGPALADRFLDSTEAEWLGKDARPIDWSDTTASMLGLLVSGSSGRAALWFNRGAADVPAALPLRAGWRWSRLFSSGEGSEIAAKAVTVYAEERVRQTAADDESVLDLAAAAGIARDWWQVGGIHHHVSPETARALLTSLGLPNASSADVEQSRRSLDSAPLPLVGDARKPVVVASVADRRRKLRLVRDDGAASEIEVPPGASPEATLEPGYYTVEGEGEQRRLIVSPGTCHVPDDILAGQRVHGIASHLYALRHRDGDGIGDFRTLQQLAAMTRETGGRYAGLNPLHHMFPSDRGRVSPYQPSDRRFVDPIYISIADMLGDFGLPKTRALAERARAGFAALDALSHVDYKAVWAAKLPLLESGFAELGDHPDLARFMADGGEALARHGRFEAMRGAENLTPERIAFPGFLQWLADRQLGKAAKHRNLYCDLAVGCAFDGGEIAEQPEIFAHHVSIGAPPDPFSATGQVWNLPPFSPLALARTGLAPLRDILNANMKHAAALRIDHVLGFARQFWVPAGAEGRDGAYIRFPMALMIAVAAIESRRNRCLIVGEDLGTVPDGLRDALAAAHILSYRVLWFERIGEGFRPPEDYPPMALACLASHDLPTFAGWRAGRDIDIALSLKRVTEAEAELGRAARVGEVAALDGLTGARNHALAEESAAAHRFVARAPSRLMLVQADDLAGETDPLNVPGTDTEWPNWRRRLHVNVEDLLQSADAKAIMAAVKAERPS